MEFKYSNPVDASTRRRFGCFTTLRVRRSIDAHEAIAANATQQMLEDMLGETENFEFNRHHYSMAPEGHVVALAVPECLPERIVVLTNYMDLGFIHDDITDSLSPSEAKIWNKGWADGFGIEAGMSSNVDRRYIKKQAEAKMMLDFIEIDRESGMLVLDRIMQLMSESATRVASDFQTFDEWLPFRCEESGAPLSHELAMFGAGAKLHKELRQAVDHIVRPLMNLIAITNDYYSFDKEYHAYLSVPGSEAPRNSVWILMKEHSTGIQEAKSILAGIITRLEHDYLLQRRTYETLHGPESAELTKYLDTAEFQLSGAFYWCSFASRYHQKQADFIPLGRQLGVESVSDAPKNVDSGLLHSAKNGDFDSCGEERITNGVQLPVASLLAEISHKSPSDKIVLTPSNYLRGLPSKGIRSIAIDALNIWFQLPDDSLAAIKSIIDLLHSSSLMLDDIEDSSTLRRGKPATHILFGVPQTINSANYLFALSLKELRKLSKSAEAHEIFSNELCNLHLGQSLDLNWTFRVHCPSESEYLTMVDNKTGGLFRVLGLLMQSESSVTIDVDIKRFTTLLGRYFQIRDDYQNLCSPDYESQKGFCEDLDEGKFSLPLIHMLNHGQNPEQAWSILHERRHKGSMTHETKLLVLEAMTECGSLEYTKKILKELEYLVEGEIEKLEGLLGSKNYVLRLLVERLRI